jgi:hypothetical protein
VRVGFEPTVAFNSYNALAKRRFRPLSHLTKTARRIYGGNLVGVKSKSKLRKKCSFDYASRSARLAGMFSRPRFPMICLLLSACFLSGAGCATLKKVLPKRKPKAETKAPAPRPVGIITLVNETDRFVLIDTETAPAPVAGTALKTFTGNVESGVVTVGAVSRRPFVVADIVRGAPQKGDIVFE